MTATWTGQFYEDGPKKLASVHYSPSRKEWFGTVLADKKGEFFDTEAEAKAYVEQQITSSAA